MADGLTIVMSGADRARKALEAKQREIEKRELAATRAAATVVRKALRKALPRDPKSKHPGYLRSHVKMKLLGPKVYRVWVGSSLAHLVLADTKEHEIVPRALIGVADGKRALAIAGKPYAHALHPAHHGDAALVPGVRVATRPAAIAAAREVMHA